MFVTNINNREEFVQWALQNPYDHTTMSDEPGEAINDFVITAIGQQMRALTDIIVVPLDCKEWIENNYEWMIDFAENTSISIYGTIKFTLLGYPLAVTQTSAAYESFMVELGKRRASDWKYGQAK